MPSYPLLCRFFDRFISVTFSAHTAHTDCAALCCELTWAMLGARSLHTHRFVPQKYRALLLGEGAEAAPRSGRANWGGGGERGDMTVTFAGGLESLGKRLKERKGAGEETVWEQYLRKKKEKKREKRRQAMRMDDSDADTDGGGSVSGDDGGLERAATEGADPFSDPFFAEGAEGDMEAAMAAEVGGEEGRGAGEKRGKGKRKGRRGEKGDREGSVEGEGAGVDGAEVARRKAELELLMMDDGELRAVGKVAWRVQALMILADVTVSSVIRPPRVPAASGKTSADVLSKYKGQEKRGAATDGDVGKSKTKKERRKEWKVRRGRGRGQGGAAAEVRCGKLQRVAGPAEQEAAPGGEPERRGGRRVLPRQPRRPPLRAPVWGP